MPLFHRLSGKTHGNSRRHRHREVSYFVFSTCGKCTREICFRGNYRPAGLHHLMYHDDYELDAILMTILDAYLACIDD